MRSKRKHSAKNSGISVKRLSMLSAYAGLGLSILAVIGAAIGTIASFAIMPLLFVSFAALALGGIGQYRRR
jgi:hypothetical protein